MTIEELDKARSYAIDKMRYNEIHSIFNEIETTVNDIKISSSFIDKFVLIDFIINWCFTMVMV
jgi:myosin-crossreactive antigen